ncbi:MAG: hypothetical protein IJY08_00695 [Clostridia bacterium]|nr:hypothetical protein [Clostridia bacterium]
MVKRISRLLCLCLALILSVSLLTGCQSSKLKPSKQALTEVGKVGDYPVRYEELVFLAENYKTDGMTEDELWALINENIITNYAILTLCDRAGVIYDEKQLEDDVQAYIDDMIATDSLTKKNYRETLRQNSMTDHYVRFTAEVDLRYAKLEVSLAQKGELLTDEEAVCEYIEENFIRTWHFMVANNEGDDAGENRLIAEDALADLKDGKTTMYKLIGGKHNEDLMISINGYTFGKGSMERAYEDAAFALDVDEYSEVVSAKGELASGEYVDCYYIIQRLSLDSDFIKENYDEMYASYTSSVIGTMLEEVKAELEFVPNDYARSLNVTDLESVGIGTDVTAIVVWSVVVVLIIAAVFAVVIIVRHVKNKEEARKAAKKALAEKKNGEKR